MGIASEDERKEEAREHLEMMGASEDLVTRHLVAFEEAAHSPAHRRWHAKEFKRRFLGLAPLEDVPDFAAYKVYCETRLRLAGVPVDFLEMSLDDIKQRSDVKGFAAALIACRDFVANISNRLEAGAGLVLCGDPGTGKSMKAALICRAAVEVGASVLFVRVRSMLDRLKDWDNATDFRADLESVDLLVLDDLGAEYGSDWTRSEIDAVVSTRHAERLSLIATSNLSPGELAKSYSPRVIDRLRERGPALELRGSSWRAKR